MDSFNISSNKYKSKSGFFSSLQVTKFNTLKASARFPLSFVHARLIQVIMREVQCIQVLCEVCMCVCGHTWHELGRLGHWCHLGRGQHCRQTTAPSTTHTLCWLAAISYTFISNNTEAKYDLIHSLTIYCIC